MNLSKFEKLMAEFPREELQQTTFEWKMFLVFCVEYFRCVGVEHPLVVELGIHKGRQKKFYLDLLQARYVSVDCDVDTHPTILGRSEDTDTMSKLILATQNAPIDLLFIDANHSLAGVMQDYALYAPLSRHLIALHDISKWPRDELGGPMVFWDRLKSAGVDTVTFLGDWDCYPKDTYPHGIGVVIKGQG